jgi:hypothetical protein
MTDRARPATVPAHRANRGHGIRLYAVNPACIPVWGDQQATGPGNRYPGTGQQH